MIETEIDVLRDVSRRLVDTGVSFMLTGSLAMSYYAQPRMTRDIDLIVELMPDHLEKFVDAFSTDYYLDKLTVAEAISRRTMFNLIHNTTIIKVDFIVRKNEPYRIEEFDRRRLITVGDFQTWIVSREDLILSKLLWASQSKSEMQLRDVKNLLDADTEYDYLEAQAEKLGMTQLLSEVKASD